MNYGDDKLPKKKNEQLVESSDLTLKPFWNLMHQMDSVFNQFFTQMNTHLTTSFLSLDTYETESDVIMEVALPGCNRNQIHLEIIGKKLRISIEDSLQEEVKYKTHSGRKQFYSRKVHILSLPYTIPEKDTIVTFQNEVLRISFPREGGKARILEIDK